MSENILSCRFVTFRAVLLPFVPFGYLLRLCPSLPEALGKVARRLRANLLKALGKVAHRFGHVYPSFWAWMFVLMGRNAHFDGQD